MRFLADENFPGAAVQALRAAGHDVTWVQEAAAGSKDEAVLQRAQDEARILITFDKDFGELAFRRGLPASSGVILLRITTPSAALSLLLPDNIDRNLHCRNRSPILKPVCSVPIFGPTYSRPIVRSDSISMVGDRSLQYVDDSWSVFMVVDRAEDASRLDGHHTHSKLAPCHALDLKAKVNRCK
jgi:predicted nuclease of predicted toxin-antitoxin system